MGDEERLSLIATRLEDGGMKGNGDERGGREDCSVYWPVLPPAIAPAAGWRSRAPRRSGRWIPTVPLDISS